MSKINVHTSLSELLPGMYYRCRPDDLRTLIYSDGRVKELTGYDKEDFNNLKIHSWYTLIHPEDLDSYIRTSSLNLRNRKKAIYTYRIITSEGTVKWIRETSGLVLNEEKVEFIDAYLEEIVGEKGDTAIFDLLKSYTEAVNVTTLVSATDQDGKILYVNDRYCEVSGYSREELIGQTHQVVNSNFHSEEFYRSMWDNLLQGKPYKAEFRNRTKKGKYFWIDSVMLPIYSQDKKTGYFLSLGTLITEKKDMQDQLIRFRAAIDSSSDCILLLDTSTKKIIDFNKTTLTKLGYKEDELRSMELISFIADLDVNLLENTFRELLNDPEKERTLETWIQPKETAAFEAEIKIRSFKNDNMENVFHISLRDITEQVLARKGLKEREKNLPTLMRSAYIGIWKYFPRTGEISFSTDILDRFDDKQISNPFSLKELSELVFEEDRLKVVYWLQNGLYKEIDTIEFRIVEYSGEFRWLKASFESFDIGINAENGIIGQIHDVTEIRKFHDIIDKINNDFLSISEQEVFNESVKLLSTAMECDYCFIGRISWKKKEAKTLAYFGRNEGNIAPFTYALKDSPCADVIRNSICVFGEDVRQKFPNDLFLSSKNVEGFIGFPITDSQNKVTGVIVLLYKNPVREISFKIQVLKLIAKRIRPEIDRIASFEKLKKSEAEFKALADNAPLHIIKLTSDLKVEYINEVKNHQLQLVPGKSVLSFIPARFVNVVKKKIQSVFKTGKSMEYEAIAYNADGDEAWYRTVVGPIFNDGGVVENVVLIAENISQKKYFEQRRRQLIIESEEKERNRLAREMHDGIGQYLAAMQMYITAISESESFSDENRSLINELKKLGEQSIQEVRKVSHDLLPRELKDIGLCEALESLCRRMDTLSSMQFHFRNNCGPRTVDELAKINIYRVAQEFIKNSLNYSGGKNMYVYLRTINNSFYIFLSDDGCGFDYEKLKGRGLGLLNIEHRIKTLGGYYNLKTAPGKGTKLIILVPMEGEFLIS